mmetsp:Transcript_26905/g.39365  ORF Transcript_26905/g.39365 Transcript_26905/m.39365 type:complete len:210 (+) Transcript_26905:140-769(+)
MLLLSSSSSWSTKEALVGNKSLLVDVGWLGGKVCTLMSLPDANSFHPTAFASGTPSESDTYLGSRGQQTQHPNAKAMEVYCRRNQRAHSVVRALPLFLTMGDDYWGLLQHRQVPARSTRGRASQVQTLGSTRGGCGQHQATLTEFHLFFISFSFACYSFSSSCRLQPLSHYCCRRYPMLQYYSLLLLSSHRLPCRLWQDRIPQLLQIQV